MSDQEMSSVPDSDPVAELRARAEMLERRLANAEQETRTRMAQAELKVEALRRDRGPRWPEAARPISGRGL